MDGTAAWPGGGSHALMEIEVSNSTCGGNKWVVLKTHSSSPAPPAPHSRPAPAPSAMARSCRIHVEQSHLPDGTRLPCDRLHDVDFGQHSKLCTGVQAATTQ